MLRRMEAHKMKKEKAFAIFAVTVLAFGFLAFFSPPAHALSPAVTDETNGSCDNFTGSPCTSSSFSVTPGNIIVFAAQVFNTPAVGVNTPSDSEGNTWNLGSAASIENSGTGCIGSVGAYYCTASTYFTVITTASASYTVSDEMQGTSCGLGGCGFYFEIIQISNIGDSVVCYGGGTYNTGTTLQTTSSCPVASTQIAIASVVGDGTLTAGAGFTAYCYSACNTASGVEYSSSPTTNPTYFVASTSTSSTWADAGIVLSTYSTVSTSSQSVGSCPSSPPGTFTPTNSTMYLYAASALGYEVVNNVTVGVDAVTGSASQAVQILLLVSTTGGQISATNPLTVAYSKVYTLTGGSGSQFITTQIAITLNTYYPMTAGNIWAVGVIGTSHTTLYTSGLSGLTYVSSNAASVAEPLGTEFTTLGASSANTICLQANASYQSLISVTSVTTTTAPATTTATTSTTFTISTINAQVLFANGQNWPLIFLLLLLPAALFMGATKNITGGLIGLMVGAVIGMLAGVLPWWIFVGLLIAVVAIAMISRERGG